MARVSGSDGSSVYLATLVWRAAALQPASRNPGIDSTGIPRTFKESLKWK